LSPLFPTKKRQGWAFIEEGDHRAASIIVSSSSSEIMCDESKERGLHLFAINS
jgi:hypothetical protein